MKKWTFQSFLLISLAFLPGFSVVLGNEALPSQPEPTEDVCTLSPPAMVMATQVGPTWIQFGWSPVPGAAQYHLVTTEAVSGIIVKNEYVVAVPTASNAHKVEGLNPGVAYNLEIWSVCQSGEESHNSNYYTGPETLILDYVIIGYQGNPAMYDWSPTCPVGLTDKHGCDFTWSGETVTYYKISHPILDRKLIFSLVVEGGVVKLRPDTGNTVSCCGPNKFIFENEGGHHVRIYFGNISSLGLVARVTISHASQSPSGLFYREDLNIGDNNLYFPIVKLQQPPHLREDGADNRNDLQTEDIAASTLSATPNPFTNTLEVKIPYATTENDVKVNLYDLQGRLMLSEKTPGGTQIRSLSTENLLPGLYLLRVDTGDRSETIKVVKTQ